MLTSGWPRSREGRQLRRPIRAAGLRFGLTFCFGSLDAVRGSTLMVSKFRRCWAKQGSWARCAGLVTPAAAAFWRGV